MSGLSPTLCDWNILEHNLLLNLEFLVFLYVHQNEIYFCCVMMLFFLCCIRVTS